MVGEERRRSIRALGRTKVQTHSRRHCDSSLCLAVLTASRWTERHLSEETTSCNSDISHRYVSCDIGVPRKAKESPFFISLPLIVYIEYLRFFSSPILACDQIRTNTEHTMSPIDPASSNILIIGCGTWGSSTALWLARSGYKNVTVLDPYPVPSAISAGNDVNK